MERTLLSTTIMCDILIKYIIISIVLVIMSNMIKLKIGVAGLGFVGGSMMKSFLTKGYLMDDNICVYDKYKDGGIGSFESLLSTDILFLALPTQFDELKKEYNKDSITEVCEQLKTSNYKGAVVIKSTVEPETTDNLADIYKLNLVHNPEFLTARTAYEDFHNQKHVVLGRSKLCNQAAFDNVHNFYTGTYPESEISLCSSIESESMKIFVNCFYSVKIQFFTELHQLCQATGSNYGVIKDLMLKNGWISDNHTNIPGPDGQISYGGLCFPKDTNALLKFMEAKGTPSMVLDATIKERDMMRTDKTNIIKASLAKKN